MDCRLDGVGNVDAMGMRESVEIACEMFGVNHSNLTVRMSNRLRTRAGTISFYRFPKNGSRESVIKLSTKLYKKSGYVRILGTLMHEVAHYITADVHSFEVAKGHGKQFKKICADLGGHMNYSQAGKEYSRFATEDFIRSDYKWKYTCPCGRASIKRKNRIVARLYTKKCRKCKTSLADFKEERI